MLAFDPMKKITLFILAVAALSACGQTLANESTSVETAATVSLDGEDLEFSGADVEQLSLATLEFQAEATAATAGVEGETTETVPTEAELAATRPTALTLQIYSSIINQLFDDAGLELEGELLETVNSRIQEIQFQTDTEFEEFINDPNEFVQTTIGLQQRLLALGTIEEVSDIEATCISHVLRSYTQEEQADPNFVEDEADQERFQQEAEEARQRIIDGELFEDVAQEISVDTVSAANGGALGCIPTDQVSTTLVPEFAEVALASEIGEISEVFESQFGFHFLVVNEDEEGIAELQAAEADNIVSMRLQTVLQGATVEVDESIGTWNPQTLQVDPPVQEAPPLEFEDNTAPPALEE